MTKTHPGAAKTPDWILDLPPSAGVFNRLSKERQRLGVTGWVFHRDFALDAIDAYVDGLLLGSCRTHRQPVTEKVHTWAAVRPLGFAFHKRLGWNTAASRLDLVCRLGDMPVSRMSCLLPRKLDNRIARPPDHLTDRVAGVRGPMFRRMGLRLYTDISDQLTRFGVAGSARILDWGCGCGRLASFILARRPRTRVFGCDIDDECINWCREHLRGEFECVPPLPPTRYAAAQMHVVVACSVLTHLTRENQQEWLREIRRILAPGGYFLASTQGDYSYRTRPLPLWKRLLPRSRTDSLSGIDDSALDNTLKGRVPRRYYRTVFQSRQYTIDACSKYFKVMDYIECGLHGLHDLVILRRDD